MKKYFFTLMAAAIIAGCTGQGNRSQEVKLEDELEQALEKNIELNERIAELEAELEELTSMD
jgi:outer membrane biogenesis lipoprotein LolB